MSHNFSRRVKSLLVSAVLGANFGGSVLAGEDRRKRCTTRTRNLNNSSNMNQNTNSNNVQANPEPIVYSQLDDIRATFNQLRVNRIVLDKYCQGPGCRRKGLNIHFFSSDVEIDCNKIFNCYRNIIQNDTQSFCLYLTNNVTYTLVDSTFDIEYDMKDFLNTLNCIFSAFEFNKIIIDKNENNLDVAIGGCNSNSDQLNALVKVIFFGILCRPSDEQNNNNSSSSSNVQPRFTNNISTNVSHHLTRSIELNSRNVNIRTPQSNSSQMSNTLINNLMRMGTLHYFLYLSLKAHAETQMPNNSQSQKP